MRISETFVIATLVEARDYGGIGILSDAIHMSKAASVGCLVTFGLVTGNSILTCYASAAQDLTTTPISFGYRLASGVFKAASGATAADQYGDVVTVTSAGLTLTAAAFAHRQMIVEFDSDAFPDGQPWLTLNVDATASVLNVAAFAVCSPRNAGHSGFSVLA